MLYNWQQEDWRQFRFNEADFTQMALDFMANAGQSFGFQSGLSSDQQRESLITILVKEAIKTSAIEGEMISREDLISSIRHNLGHETPSRRIRDKRSEGIANLLFKSRENFDADLTEAELFEWHKQLMLGNFRIEVGAYRHHDEPMQVISGAVGKEIVHFEAPPSAQVPAEMQFFIEWFNATKPGGKRPIHNLLVRAAIAHVYFESIHPFEDGNGRIGRVIAEKVLSQGLKKPILMSLSSAIEANKKDYYNALKLASRTNDLTEWIQYFSKTILEAQADFAKTIDFSIKKAAFFDKNKAQLTEAQLKVVSRMLEEGEGGFEGGMNARKYQAIAQVSKPTATRHLQDLVEKGVLIATGGGRSTNYQVNLG